MIITESDRQTLLITAATLNSLKMLTEAVIVHHETHQTVNGSLCRITSLEVYRGRQQIIEIIHNGLSLIDDVIKVKYN